MILFLDFDDTLCNTKRFNESLGKHLMKVFNLEKDVFTGMRQAVRNIKPRDEGYYNLDAHIEFLARYVQSDVSRVKQEVFYFVAQHISEYIFPDVHEFLKIYKEIHQCVLITMTFDESEYQFRKVAHSGIADYFYDILYTAGEPKSLIIKTYLRSIPKSQKPIFLDDRRNWLSDAVRENPALLGVHMKREDRRHDEESGEHVPVKDMKEFDKLLASL